jgi:4-carboxymuconolactone decarboxylase
MSEKLYEAGLKAGKEVVGEEYVAKALDTADSFNQEFQNYVTEYCWGTVWGDTGGEPALSRKQHSLNNLCILSALNRPHEFKLHFRGALRNGCTLDELKETLTQVAVYCGIPAGVEAFRLAREVLDAEGIKPEAAK